MRRRADPNRLAELVVVQRVRRLAAEAALSAARDDERTALADRDAAADHLGEAEVHWVDHVTATTFAPERSRALARSIIASETLATRADERLGESRETLDRCGDAWRVAEAQVRSIERDHAIAIRDAGHRLEEKRLAERDDRTMRTWRAA